jgi:hypothetical protein
MFLMGDDAGMPVDEAAVTGFERRVRAGRKRAGILREARGRMTEKGFDLRIKKFAPRWSLDSGRCESPSLHPLLYPPPCQKMGEENYF